jgi:hypothetical protein
MACKESTDQLPFFPLLRNLFITKPFLPPSCEPRHCIHEIPQGFLTQWIFVGMGIGLALGWFAPDLAVSLRPLSTIFLRLIKTIIAPLIFATLVVGIAGQPTRGRQNGRESADLLWRSPHWHCRRPVAVNL